MMNCGQTWFLHGMNAKHWVKLTLFKLHKHWLEIPQKLSFYKKAKTRVESKH
jgi:hypothetical protein